MNQSAIEKLTELVDKGHEPKSLDQTLDTMKLLGVVLGYHTLLDIAVNGEDKERVSAAKSLIGLREDPESISDRLRRSAFSGLTVAQLKGIIDGVGQGKALHTLIAAAKEPSNDSSISGSES